MKKLKVGVLGLGFIGELHARIFSEIPNADLVAVADIDAEKAKEMGDKYNCNYYSDNEEFFADDNFEAVSICVPDKYHVEPSIMAAEAGNDILLEKPIARTVDDARKIQESAEKNDVRLMVAHVLRFDPRYVQLHDEMENGNIGELIHIRAKRQSPKEIQKFINGRTSMLFYVGVHDIDIMRWVAKSEVEEVFARKVSKVYDEDCIFISLKFKNGAVGSLEFSWSLPDHFSGGLWSEMEVVGTEGAGYVDVNEQGFYLFTNDSFTRPDILHWPEYNGQINGDLREELLHFSDAILKEKEFIMPTEDAIKAIEIIEGVFESIEKSKPVKI